MNLKNSLLLICAIYSLSCFAQTSPATFPDKPVTIVVPFPPGGGTDAGARLIAQKLSVKWGQSVIIDNKGGAAGIVGSEFVSRAQPEATNVANQ